MVRRNADDTTINEQSSMTSLLHETAICHCFLFDNWLFVAQRGPESVSHCSVPSPGVCGARIILASFDPTCPLTKFETNEFGCHGHHVCFLHLQRGRALGVVRPADEVASSAPYMYNRSRNSSPNLKHWTRVEVVDRFHPLNNFCGDCMAQAF